MEHNVEYHDPDYPEISICVKEDKPSLTEEEKVEKIKQIVRREFRNEMSLRENEVVVIDQRMTTVRRYLHQLRYALVNNYYRDQKLQISSSQIEDEVAAQSEPRARAEVSSILRDSQQRLHPSVRKLLGKKTVDLEEIFKSRGPRNKTRKDYSAMVHAKNITISADSTKSLRPSIDEPENKTDETEPETIRPKKIPRHLEPKIDNVLTLDAVTRNKQKHRYRIIIGNTSKYMPPASRADRSTHKWLLYVRGPPLQPDLSRILTSVTVRLHHSYAPHHIVVIEKPPFQVSRRGWGEFPARVTLNFAMADCNRPATLSHTIKLDRNYTGLQMLGAETVADVWLYSTPEMLEFEYKTVEECTLSNEKSTAEQPKDIKIEPESDTIEKGVTHSDEWLKFFSNDNTEVNVDEMLIKNIKQEKEDIKEEVIETIEKCEVKREEAISNGDSENNLNNIEIKPNEVNNCDKRIMKYIDPTTGKIYYLEMDRALDLNKIQEIVINSQSEGRQIKTSKVKTNGHSHVRKKTGVSLLKPEVKNQLKSECNYEKVSRRKEFEHIKNDHCYLGTDWSPQFFERATSVKPDANKSAVQELKSVIKKFSCPRVVISYLLKKIPLVSMEANNADFVKQFPFVVENDDKYWKLDFAKRRNIEWSRAKEINKMLAENFNSEPQKIWRTKQILVFSRLHGYYPIRSESLQKTTEKSNMDTNEWSSWNDLENSRQLDSNIRDLYPNSEDLCSLTLFKSEQFLTQNTVNTFDLCESDEDIDIISDSVPVKVKKAVLSKTENNLTMLPVSSEERQRFLFIEKKCADIGIELRNENIGNGYSYSAVHSTLLTAMKCFAEELIRAGLADQLAFSNDPHLPSIWIGSSSRTSLRLEHVYRATVASRRLRVLTTDCLAAEKIHTQAL